MSHMRNELRSLEGRVLACDCPLSQACEADVLAASAGCRDGRGAGIGDCDGESSSRQQLERCLL